ncbi:hypothetical protein H0H92_011597 [Tricholoma furcatifolium]|nr:hypothetical protein H0H92_011597 [Tricholoma furcatifolium]
MPAELNCLSARHVGTVTRSNTLFAIIVSLKCIELLTLSYILLALDAIGVFATGFVRHLILEDSTAYSRDRLWLCNDVGSIPPGNPFQIPWVAVTWLAFAAGCDLLITLVQVVFLHRHRSGIPATNRLVKILTLYIMSTGLLTSIVAILELTTFATLGFNYVHVFLSQVMGAIRALHYKMVAVTLMRSLHDSLDARRTIRLAATDPGTMGMNNLNNLQTTRNPERTLDIMFQKKIVSSSDNEASFPSTTTKISDLHVHPNLGDLKDQAASHGSVYEV